MIGMIQNCINPFDLTELMSFSLTPVPHTLDSANGFFNKTNKATMPHYLLEDDMDEVTYPKDTLNIQDGLRIVSAVHC